MSIFEYMMRHAAPVLFWVSVLLLAGVTASAIWLQMDAPYVAAGGITARVLVVAIHQGLNSAAWPFFGAGLIWTLQKRKDRDE